MDIFVVFCVSILFVNSFVRSITFEEDLTLNSEQKLHLDQLKQRLESQLPYDYMKKEIFLIKWLRPNNFNVDIAESRILHDLKWREEQKMDKIHSENWSDMWEAFNYHLDGRDKQGRPYLYIDVGDMDLRKQVILGKSEKILRYVDKVIDESCNLVRELGEKYGNVTRGQLLINLAGYNIVEHGCLRCVPVLLRIVLSYQTHWPECVDQIIAVNSPASLHPLLNAIIPLLDNSLKNSLHIYGTNRQTWSHELAKNFDTEELPRELGGSKVFNRSAEDEFELAY